MVRLHADRQAARPARTERVKGDLYMISGEGGNVALYVTAEGVVLVDDMFDRNHDDILAQIKSVTDRPLRYVINTHQHDDHAGGDLKMLPIAEVIAHKNVRANLRTSSARTTRTRPARRSACRASPSRTSSPSPGRQGGAGRTTSAAGTRAATRSIYFPEAEGHSHRRPLPRHPRRRARCRTRARAATGVPIYVDYVQGGSFLEWTKTLDGMLKLDFDTVIPGHGPVVDARRHRAVQGQSRDDADAPSGLIKGGTAEGRAREDPRGRLRLALDRMSAESADRRDACSISSSTH